MTTRGQSQQEILLLGPAGAACFLVVISFYSLSPGEVSLFKFYG